METLLANYYEVEESQILLAATGSSALCALLMEFPCSKIALPSFCCLEVVQAILQAGSIPVFLEMNEQLQFTEESVHFAASQECTFFIWPHLFGTRTIPLRLKILIRSLKMFLIEDQAQSFPEFGTTPPLHVDAVLFSFGLSKKLGGIGGGGLCLYHKELRAAAPDLGKTSYGWKDHLRSLLFSKIRLHSPSFAHRLKLFPHQESDLKTLLEKKSLLIPPPLLKLSSMQKERTVFLWKAYVQKKDSFSKNLEHLKIAAKKCFGTESLKWMEGIEFPSIFALDGGFNRHDLFSYFSQRGIQTTWYYYPLPKLTAFQNFLQEPLATTPNIASRIVVLPFQWKHSDRQVKYLIQSIGECEDYDSR